MDRTNTDLSGDAPTHDPTPVGSLNGSPGTPDLSQYESFVVLTSGGKDSAACFLHLLDLGVPRDKIELHHHLVDGPDEDFMDWPVTKAYCEAFAKAFGVRLVFTWREGGFLREMLRDNQPTAPSVIPGQDGQPRMIGGKGPAGTRKKFPQVSANLSVRWCSAYLKIGPGDAYFTNTARFQDGRKHLVISGERAEESASRAKYHQFEVDRCDNRGGARINRWLDHWRAVHAWSEQQIWDIIRRYRVNPHPAYMVGLSRASCAFCIFGGPDQWTTMRQIAPVAFERVATFEQQFGVTIHRSKSVRQQADRGALLPGAMSAWAAIAMQKEYKEPIFVDDWKLPAGAFGNSAGPT